MPRNYRRRAALIYEADRLLEVAEAECSEPDVAARAMSEAAERYRRAGLSNMAAATQAAIGQILGCGSGNGRWTPRMVDLALEIDLLTSSFCQPPTWEEVARALGVTTGTARDLADCARARGLVTWDRGQPRTLRINRSGARR